MFETADPKQKFFVANSVRLYPDTLQILVRLYQPLVGAMSISLYQTLVYNYSPHMILSDSRGLYYLQEQMDCGLKDIFKSLHKLEAVGLVKTHLVDNEVSSILAFELLKVPSSQEFFSTALLTSLLREKVGQSAFYDLSQYFATKARMHQQPVKKGKDISASFFDVFRLPEDEAITPSVEVQEAAAANQVGKIASAQVNEKTGIDWDYMKDRFRLYHIDPQEIEAKKAEIISLMQLYGINEQEFIDETLPTLHGESQLNLREISRLLSESYKNQNSKQQIQQTVQQNQKMQVSVKLSDEHQAILLEARRKTPAEFLYFLKSQKGGYTTASENKVLNSLINRGLPVEFVNILTYVCLQYDSVLAPNLANKIANDWLQNHVATAEQALAYIEKRPAKIANSRRSRAVTVKRHEQKTDWSKVKAKTDSNIDLNQLDNMFRNLEDSDDSQEK
ncbi:replicative DNA helicase DnaB [Lactobacillus pasteurii DSM 23907 = CRBIP 24.76]|uniref:Replicative DNA helicase DnaB n=1 Tax=Lactobacillus pasteurii DSM 23907 = CRBIP 24.76 TaxID=1423790 RepID=I7LBQ1_9LACO|nr:DnaD domain protein [Lactobacillus pasteurii]KRK08342.1 replicative DNA helicase DnaB [Lactobacillus pasteurii DSM 23907 = CRBIP 24.76]TDG75520.1 hypothetical protein C5L33_000405 [Lactobacillus pasteurii]CCI85801.1 Replicative DNA helicase DnaB [Lactobacillus pasteurii DSM 23907 = CRBIP 24.76]